MSGMYSIILERHYKKGGRSGRFKISESVTNHYKNKYDHVANQEGEYVYYSSNNKFYKKKKGNESFGLRKNVRFLNKLSTVEEIVDVKDYVMPIYMNNFIDIKSFMPRDSNRLKFKLRIPRDIRTKTGAVSYYPNRKKVFDTYFSAKKYALRLEKEHIQYTKSLYGEYYKTHSYK